MEGCAKSDVTLVKLTLAENYRFGRCLLNGRKK